MSCVPKETKCPLAPCSTDILREWRWGLLCLEAQDISSSNTFINNCSFTNKTLCISSLSPFSLSLPLFPHFPIGLCRSKLQFFPLDKEVMETSFLGSYLPQARELTLLGLPVLLPLLPWPSRQGNLGDSGPQSSEILYSQPCHPLGAIFLSFLPSSFSFPYSPCYGMICHPDLAIIWNSKQLFNSTNFVCLIINLSSTPEPLVEVISSNTFPHHPPSCDFPYVNFV